MACVAAAGAVVQGHAFGHEGVAAVIVGVVVAAGSCHCEAESSLGVLLCLRHVAAV